MVPRVACPSVFFLAHFSYLKSLPMHSRFAPLAGIALFLLLLIQPSYHAVAGDWPAWRYDAGHTAASPYDLPIELHEQWARHYSPRQPVWDDPLNRDMMPYDRVFEPVVADGRMFIGFNDADKVVALDVRDGSELWAFYTDGPIRFSPVVSGSRVLLTSDDGYLYCVGADSGKLLWRFRGGPTDRKVLGNQRVISTWPARGGPVVCDGTVYFAASIWPFMGTFIYALEAETGKVQWVNDDTSAQYQKQPHSAPAYAGIAPQGQLAIAGDLLLVPGGRTLPAGLDRLTGELRFFNFGGKGEGGSFVATDGTRAFVHTRRKQVVEISLDKGLPSKLTVNEPVLGQDILFTPRSPDGEHPSGGVEAYGHDGKLLWQLDVDGSGDLIRAGDRLYAAGGGKLTAIDLPRGDRGPRVAWTKAVDGDVQRLLAAADRLFAVTLEGRILAFGEQGSQSGRAVPNSTTDAHSEEALADQVGDLLDLCADGEGYALWFDVGDGRLLHAVAMASKLQIVGVDPDPLNVDSLRRQWDAEDLYGDRISLHVGTPNSFQAPQYLANLIVLGATAAKESVSRQSLRSVFRSLRPYGGKMLLLCDAQGKEALRTAVASAELPEAEISDVEAGVLVSRNGALPGAADWTHTYGDVANTVKSNDSRVRLPLGLLWFGGSSNSDVLPRHGHGPSEQVVGGRLFIEGMDCMSARDVYTGRVLWKRQFSGLGLDGVYFDDSYEDTPLSTAYNQLHVPGATSRGTNYVATPEGVYLAIRDRCLLLDPSTGKTLREFELPANADGSRPQWGYIGVYKDLLLAGVDLGRFAQRLGYEYVPAKKRGPAWSPEHSASLELAAFDRATGEQRWCVAARHSFLHNGIVAGGGRIYLLDKLPKRVEEQNARRGLNDQQTYRLLAIDARTGEEQWSTDNVFGTWLGYSSDHDVLLQAGAAATDRSLDEVDKGMIVHAASDGKPLWENRELTYAGPCILHGDVIITNSTSYHENQGAYHLLDGSPVMLANPVTGEPTAWKFFRNYGCNTAVASEHLLTFRSGAAGFYDLANHSGTGNFGGFKSGCSSNLIVADGVLNAPDYTRTCTCGYQNQTSLALVPMDENEFWTFNLFEPSAETSAVVRRVGINLGAPGDRRTDTGTLWVNYPRDAGPSPELPIEVAGEVQWFVNHSSRIDEDELPWVAASGVEGIEQLSVGLGRSDKPRQFTVRIFFVEPDVSVGVGQRVFDVEIQGQKVAARLDVEERSGGPLRSFVSTHKGISVDDQLRISLTSHTDRLPVLCGVEIVEVER